MSTETDLECCQLGREPVHDHLHMPWLELARVHLERETFSVSGDPDAITEGRSRGELELTAPPLMSPLCCRIRRGGFGDEPTYREREELTVRIPLTVAVDINQRRAD